MKKTETKLINTLTIRYSRIFSDWRACIRGRVLFKHKTASKVVKWAEHYSPIGTTKMKPGYAPPKEIGSALRAMFDYQDNKDFDGQTGLERSYNNGWQRLLVLKGWTHADAEGFLKYIKETEVDPDAFLDYKDPFKTPLQINSL